MKISEESNPLIAGGKNPWLLLLSLTGITIGGLLFIGTVMTLITALIIYGSDISMLNDLVTNPYNHPEQRMNLLIFQGVFSLAGFIIAPFIFYYTMIRGNFARDFFKLPRNIYTVILITIIIVFSFMVVNTVFIEWNVNLNLPDSLSGFENWAQEQEDQRAVLTEYLTVFDSMGYLILAILVIAVIPGVGEELLFRGFLQNIFQRIVKNDHAAVWISAFLFSAIHIQFYGLVPRMLLGALFGYLYLWSGNLLVPMIAHFVNNCVSLIALYTYQQGLTEIDVESTEAFPIVYIIIFSALFVASVLYFKYSVVQKPMHEGLGRRL